MSSNSADDWDEYERLADKHRKEQKRGAEPVDDGPIHIGDVPATDDSDGRKYQLGISNVDRQLGPLRPKATTLVAAISGYGKTVLAEQISIANAREHTVVFATLEMLVDEVRDSMLARMMGLPLDDAEREKRDNSDRYREAFGKLDELSLHLWRPGRRRPCTAATILGVAQKVKASVLVIDYTKQIDGWEPGNKASAIVEELSEGVKDLSLHLVLLAQLKLESNGRRPTPADIEDTKRLYHEAEKVVFVHRPFFGDKKRDVITELVVPKNRKGKVFTGHTHWYGPMRTYYAMDDVDESRVECCKPKKKRAAAATATPPDERAKEDRIMNDLGQPQDLFPT